MSMHVSGIPQRDEYEYIYIIHVLVSAYKFSHCRGSLYYNLTRLVWIDVIICTIESDVALEERRNGHSAGGGCRLADQTTDTSPYDVRQRVGWLEASPPVVSQPLFSDLLPRALAQGSKM